MAQIDTPWLITGGGPGAWVAARIASGSGLQSLVVGEAAAVETAPATLAAETVDVLKPHGVLDVLRPYLATHHPPSIAPAVFEGVLKHHCVVDMNITVFDRMRWEPEPGPAPPTRGRVRDAHQSFAIRADAHLDAGKLPRALSEAILAGAAAAEQALRDLRARDVVPR